MKAKLSRRSFLGLAGAMVCASRASAESGGWAGANDTVRIGVIGCGDRGACLASGILKRRRRREKTTLAAVCDIYDPCKREARALTGARVHDRWQDLIEAKDIDGVIIAAPNHLHAPMAIAAMQCGKDVYCEPPMTLRVDEAKAFRDCAARTGRVVQIGVEPVAEGQWRAARRLIERGAIGPVVWSQGSYNSQTTAAWNNLSASEVRRPVMAHELDWHAFLGDAPPRAFSAERYAAWWKYWDYSGGIASEVFYAKLAPLLVATGAAFPERVSAAGGVYVQDGREVPDTFVMNAEYPEGHTIVLASSMAQAQDLPAVIRGRDGSLELTSNGLRVVPETPSEATTVAVAPAPGLIDNWLACMRTREACVCDVELGYRTMVAIGMAVDAYRGHKTLYFDAIQEAVLASPPRSLPTRTFEDRLDALDAETALREFRASGEQSVPYEEGRKKAHLA